MLWDPIDVLLTIVVEDCSKFALHTTAPPKEPPPIAGTISQSYHVVVILTEIRRGYPNCESEVGRYLYSINAAEEPRVQLVFQVVGGENVTPEMIPPTVQAIAL